MSARLSFVRSGSPFFTPVPCPPLPPDAIIPQVLGISLSLPGPHSWSDICLSLTNVPGRVSRYIDKFQVFEVENSPDFVASCSPKPTIDYSKLSSCKTPSTSKGPNDGKLVVVTVVVVAVVVVFAIALVKMKQGKTKQEAKFKQYVDQVEAGRVEDEAVQNDAFQEMGATATMGSSSGPEATSGYVEVAGVSAKTVSPCKDLDSRSPGTRVSILPALTVRLSLIFKQSLSTAARPLRRTVWLTLWCFPCSLADEGDSMGVSLISKDEE